MSMVWPSQARVQNVHKQPGSARLLEPAIISPGGCAHLLRGRALAMRRDTAFPEAGSMLETA